MSTIRFGGVFGSLSSAPSAASFGVGEAVIGGRKAWSNGVTWSFAPRQRASVTGILPYGSSDPSVVFRHPLTYAPSASELRYGSLTVIGDAEGPTYHSVKGIKPRSPTANAFSGLAFTSPESVLISRQQELSRGGQLRFEIERAYLGGTNALTGITGGYVPAANEVFLSLQKDGSGSKPLYALWKQTTTNVGAQGIGVNTFSSLAERRTQNYLSGSNKAAFFDGLLNAAIARTPTTDETVSNASIIHHGTLPEFAEVVVSWSGGNGGLLLMFIDGIPFGGKIGNAEMSNMLEALVFGAADRYSTFQAGAYFVRNFQLSTKPVDLDTTGITKRIGVLSDSIIGCNSYAFANQRQNLILHRIQKALVAKGIYYENLYIATNGGHCMSQVSSTQNFVTSSVDPGDSPRGRVKATIPSIVIINGTGNDMGACTDQQYIDALTDHLDYFFSVGAYAGATDTPVEAAVFTTIHDRTSFSSPNRTQSQSINTMLRSFVATYSALRPQLAGRVFLADTWYSLNGTTDFTGHLSDGTHPDWLGYKLYGECIADAIITAAKAVDCW